MTAFQLFVIVYCYVLTGVHHALPLKIFRLPSSLNHLYSAFCCCVYLDEDGRIVTNVGHDSEDLIAVNGYQDPGSYVRHVNYVTERIEALEDVIERAQMCRQYVTYRCNNSKLLYNEGE